MCSSTVLLHIPYTVCTGAQLSFGKSEARKIDTTALHCWLRPRFLRAVQDVKSCQSSGDDHTYNQKVLWARLFDPVLMLSGNGINTINAHVLPHYSYDTRAATILNGTLDLSVAFHVCSPLVGHVDTSNRMDVCVGFIQCKPVVSSSTSKKIAVILNTGQQGIRFIWSFSIHKRLGAID